MADEDQPPSNVVPHPARGLMVDEHEDAFAAAMMRIARPTDEKDETDAEYAAAEALKLSSPGPVIRWPGEDDMPIPMDYEGED
jgi:hypothetical protein